MIPAGGVGEVEVNAGPAFSVGLILAPIAEHAEPAHLVAGLVDHDAAAATVNADR